MYIIFAYWNESGGARTLDMYIIFAYWNESRTLDMYIIFAYWNESGGARTLDMYIIFAYWNKCGGGMALWTWHTHERNAS
jgi:hypothetical protein